MAKQIFCCAISFEISFHILLGKIAYIDDNSSIMTHFWSETETKISKRQNSSGFWTGGKLRRINFLTGRASASKSRGTKPTILEDLWNILQILNFEPTCFPKVYKYNFSVFCGVLLRCRITWASPWDGTRVDRAIWYDGRWRLRGQWKRQR